MKLNLTSHGKNRRQQQNHPPTHTHTQEHLHTHTHTHTQTHTHTRTHIHTQAAADELSHTQGHPLPSLPSFLGIYIDATYSPAWGPRPLPPLALLIASIRAHAAKGVYEVLSFGRATGMLGRPSSAAHITTDSNSYSPTHSAHHRQERPTTAPHSYPSRITPKASSRPTSGLAAPPAGPHTQGHTHQTLQHGSLPGPPAVTAPGAETAGNIPPQLSRRQRCHQGSAISLSLLPSQRPPSAAANTLSKTTTSANCTTPLSTSLGLPPSALSSLLPSRPQTAGPPSRSSRSRTAATTAGSATGGTTAGGGVAHHRPQTVEPAVTSRAAELQLGRHRHHQHQQQQQVSAALILMVRVDLQMMLS